MKPTTTQERTYELIKTREMYDDFTGTKKDAQRYAKALALLLKDLNNVKAGNSADSGLYGKVAEILSHDSDSTITKVQKQGATDVYIIIDGKRTKCEYKTNGGRIESLYHKRNKSSSYIIYELDYIKPAGKHVRKDGTVAPSERRRIEPTLMTIETFLAIIEDTKAVKVIGHNENDRERAVQADSKKLYNALKEFNGTKYDRAKTYTSANIK